MVFIHLGRGVRWLIPVAAIAYFLSSTSRIKAQAGAVQNPPRLDAPFTLAVETPHVAWGKPSLGGPVRTLVVPSVSEGRTLVELAERMDLAFDTVMIDEAWDVNTWTVGMDENYEARNYKLAYQYLAEDLASLAPYDVIVLPSVHGWNRLPQAAREAIRKRVEQGTGLVLIHPTTGIPAPDDPKVQGPLNDFVDTYDVQPGEELWELSPLVGVLSDRLDARGFREIRPDAVAAGPWKSVARHFITRNVPLDFFPTEYLKHYKYRLGREATALVAGPDGEPIVATKTYGRGRVVALGYLNRGLSPEIPWKDLGERDDHWWEYFYSLLCRSILWAAKREPLLELGAMTVSAPEGKVSAQVRTPAAVEAAKVTAAVHNEWGESEGSLERTVRLHSGSNTVTFELPQILAEGGHVVDAILAVGGKHYDWGSVTFDLPKCDEIGSLSTDRAFYARGEKVRASVKTRSGKARNVVVDLLDNRGRLIGRGAKESVEGGGSSVTAEVEVGNYSTNIGWLRATLVASDNAGAKAGPRHAVPSRIIDRKQVRVNFAALDRDFGAYELIMPWYGPPTYQPWIPALDDQFRKMGVTVVENPERNFKIVEEVRTPGFGVYWHYRQPYLEQKDKFLETGDKRYLIRDPDLASDKWLDELRGVIRSGMEKDKGLRPLAYYLTDESSLTAYGDPFDFSWSAPTLVKFREWLKTQYPTLAALNDEWGWQFASWDDVVPLTTAEAQAKGNFAGWMDHRTFMEQVFAQALRVAAETVKQEDPGGRPSISGTQEPGPSNAVNWYLLDQIVDYLQPYSDDDQDELHRTTRVDLVLTGFTGYENHGKALRYQLWHRLLHGQIGASLFWQYTALNADLTLTEQGRDLRDTIGEFRNEGLALLLRGAERENCGIAVHYSLLSVRGEWITDGCIRPHEVASADATSAHVKRFHANRHAWLQALEDAGSQYDFVTTEQIEAGKLAQYRILILPDSIALSDAEVAEVRKFVERGGTILCDAETGMLDAHARWQKNARVDDVLGVERGELRSAPGGAVVNLQVALPSGATDLKVIPADRSLRATTGKAAASAAGAPFFIENRFGSGRAVTLNFWMADYTSLRSTPQQSARLAVLRDQLNRAGVHPVADVRKASGEPLRCSEIVAYRKGVTRYLSILPEPRCEDAGLVKLALPSPQYVYELRAHRSLGRVAEVSGKLAGGKPIVYALLPAPVGRLSIAPVAAGFSPASVPTGGSMSRVGNRLYIVQAGGTVKFNIRLTRANVAARLSRYESGNEAVDVPDDAIDIEVRNPIGKIVDYYGANLPVHNGHAEFSVYLALNDRPGLWRVTIREPFTHRTSSATFVVKR